MRRILTWLSILTAAAFAQTSFSEDSLNVVANDPGGSFSAAWVDYNGDGNLDLFVANGDDFTSTPRNNFLYRNDGGGDFFPITSGAIAADLTDTRGCSWGDYDNDGDPDLFVAVAFDDNSLYRNDGGDNFTKMTPSEVGSIVSDGGGSLGACWGDYDNDGDLDLFVANDSGFADLPCFLYENDGSGFFTRVLDGTAFPMVNAYGPHRSAAWGDYDNDGYIDLFLARFGRNELYHNLGGSGFEKILSGDIVNDQSVSAGGSWGDYDNDGDLDLFVPNGLDLGMSNDFYRNNGDGSFTRLLDNQAYPMLDADNAASSSWIDYDNDGDLDLFIANVLGTFTKDDPGTRSVSGENGLYQNNGDGTFTRMTDTGAYPMVAGGDNTFAGIWGDYNNDGALDLFTAVAQGNNRLFRQDGNSNHWLQVKLEGTESNRSAIGARVEVSAAISDNRVRQIREITSQDGANTQNGLMAAFGLGNAALVDTLIVHWPSGIVQAIYNVATDQVLTIVESANQPPYRQFALPDTSSQVGHYLIYDLIGLETFVDPDGDSLSFSAFSADTNIALAESFPPGYLFVYPVGAGTTEVVVIADDLFGGTAADTFLISVLESSPPVVANAIPDTVLNLDAAADFRRDLGTVFSNPSGDSLLFSAESFNSAVAFAEVSGDTLIVTPAVPYSRERALIWVYAMDAITQQSVADSFTFAVNRPPLAFPPPLLVLEQGAIFTLDLLSDGIFSDPDADTLVFEAVSSDPDQVVAGMSGSVLTLQTGFSSATDTILVTVTARDLRFGQLLSATGATLQTVVIGYDGPVISYSPETVVDLGNDILVDAQVLPRDNVPVDSVALYYHSGGQYYFNRLDMTASGDRYQATIPGDSVTVRNLEYFIQARDQLGRYGFWPGAVGSFSPSVRVENLVKSEPLPAGNAQSAYRLVSFPLIPDDPTPAALLEDDLGEYDNTVWRFFEPLGGGQFTEFDEIAAVSPGHAYWLLSSEADRTLDTGPGELLPVNGPLAIPLHAGWNYIGLPFNFALSPYNLYPKNASGFYIFDYQGGWQDPAELLQPFAGYALSTFEGSADTLLIFPWSYGGRSPRPEPLAKANPRNDYDWAIRIGAESRGARDDYNFAGVSAAATDAWDGYDVPEPPAIGDFVALSFPHPEWERYFSAYTCDIRGTIVTGDVWDIEVRANFTDEVRLRFSGLSGVPEDLEVWLIDVLTGETRNLRSDSSYALAGRSGQAPRPLKLLVGQANYVQETLAQLDLLPGEFALLPNFPNPFNPTTTIRYALPAAAKVDLAIYNLLGQKIATLLREAPGEAGYHSVIWNGRDDAGQPVASGIYFLHLRAGAHRAVRKMILLK